MNNERFKVFLRPYVVEAVEQLSNFIAEMRGNEMPTDFVINFVAGYVCREVVRVHEYRNEQVDWRELDDHSPVVIGGVFTLEELRRTYDFIRLYLETGSTTS